MVKTYCDACGQEIQRNYVDERLHRGMMLGGRKWRTEVIVSWDGVAKTGDLCLECLLKIINEGREIEPCFEP